MDQPEYTYLCRHQQVLTAAKLLVLCVFALGPLGPLVACSSTPNPGHSGGRMSWSEDAPSDYGGGTADFAEASDIIARSLAADLDRLIRDEFPLDTQVVVIVGDFNNSSRGAIQTGDLELVRNRITSSLMKSDVWQDNVQIRRPARRIEDINRRERGGGDLLGGGAADVDVQRADLAYTYYLNGDAFGSTKGSTFFRMTFTLDHALTGQTVFSESYEQKYQ